MNLNICYTRYLASMCFWMEMIAVVVQPADVTFTVYPSTDVEVEQVVTLQCMLDPKLPIPIIVAYKLESASVLGKTLCTLEPFNGTCKNPLNQCSSVSNYSCPSETISRLQFPVLWKWNEGSVFCEIDGEESNHETFSVKVPVKSVTLNSTSVTVTAGQQKNLTCTTSYCYPPANITWYMSPTDITSQSTYRRQTEGGLVKTISSLSIKVGKSDNGKELYCSASNIPSRILNSMVHPLTVLYKPEVISIPPSSIKVREGEEALLECKLIAANPNKSITWNWWKDGSVFHNKPTYKIQNITRQMSGKYSCTANNTIGISEPATIGVDVQYKPEIASTTSPHRVKEGQNATLNCILTAANPNTSITWIWLKTDNTSNVLQNGSYFTILNIQRYNAGKYSCYAVNEIGESVPVTIEVDVQYKPEIISTTSSPYRVIEGQRASLVCLVTTANPKTNITWIWFNTDRPDNVLHRGANYTIHNIKRKESGTYNCTASNSVGISVPVKVELDVQYKPEIADKPSTVVNESDEVILNREVVSNPLSDVFWYTGSELLHTQLSVRNATFIISKALCTDTKNFTLVANNSVGRNVTVMELIVNCKPRSFEKNITLGVTDRSGIEFSIVVIAYPEPRYELQYENGSKNYQIMDSIIRNAVFNFTIHFNQTVVTQQDYGTYFLILENEFGEANVSVNVIPQRKPNNPNIYKFECEVTRAKIHWTSSFNGGDSQTFTVIALDGQQQLSNSEDIPDKGENQIHFTYVQSLKPSTTYVFYVSAHNTHGFSSSENISCTTKEASTDSLPIITGSVAAGGITLAIIVVVFVVLIRRYSKQEKQAVKSQRLENDADENIDAADDGLKENFLYVSAGPRENENTNAAMYADVNKKEPESNNNSNVYADVKKIRKKVEIEGDLYSDVKPKKGFFKKDEKPEQGARSKQNKGLFKKDEKAKHIKGKKPKNRPGEADVYENSEDIAMSTNVDNVYSNAGLKGLNKQEERGYKNKDGLLYVEVNFDGKQGQDNPVIHGEDEKTDYATVEFPMPSALHKASGSEEL